MSGGSWRILQRCLRCNVFEFLTRTTHSSLNDIDPSTEVFLADHAETDGTDMVTRFFSSFLCDDMTVKPHHKVSASVIPGDDVVRD